MRFFPTLLSYRQKISKETLFIIKTHSTTHATFTGSIFTSTHTHHARCYRTRARPGCWVMREVRFRLSASKNFMKEKKMCLTHEFLDPFVSRVASECFFFFPLFLSLLLSLVVVDLDDDDDRRPRSNNAKDLRIGWSPARSSSR